MLKDYCLRLVFDVAKNAILTNGQVTNRLRKGPSESLCSIKLRSKHVPPTGELQ